MLRPLSLTAGAALVVLAACQPSNKPQPLTAADSAAIDKVRSEYQTAWNAGNVDGVLRLFASGAEVHEQDTPAVKGENALRTYLNTAMGTPQRPKLEIMRGTTVGRQDLAVEVGRYTLTLPAPAAPAKGAAPAAPAPITGKYLVVLMKQADGSWKLTYDSGTLDAPMAPPAPAETGRKARRR